MSKLQRSVFRTHNPFLHSIQTVESQCSGTEVALSEPEFLHLWDKFFATLVAESLSISTMNMAFSPTGLISFREFIDFKPDGKVYELYDGIASEMQPVGQHEEIVGFLAVNIAIEIGRLALPYLLPKQALIKVLSQAKSFAFETESAYCPDVLVVKRSALAEEPLWSSASTLTKGSSLALVVEVVSTNWRIDYGNKLNDYEALGISEYWIIDYVPLAGKRVIGEPRVPTVSVYRLFDDEFTLERFQANEQIISDIFPEINLTANQIFKAVR